MTVISADNVNRTQKLLMDLGKSGSVEEAEATLQGFILQVVCGARIASSATMQAALLTIVNTASRCFLGGVQIVGCPASRLLINYGTQDDLHAAVRELGGDMSSDLRPTLPTIQIDSEEPMESANLRITFEGWRAGVVPVTDVVHLPEKTEFVISGIFAGAVAVAEVFQFLSQTHAEAARRPV